MARPKSLAGILFVLMLMSSVIASAQESETQKSGLNLGVGAGGSISEYRDYGLTIMPLPILNYEGERFFMRGLTGGIHLYKNAHHEISLNVSYLPQSFDADESGSHAMRQLDDRYSTMLAGASYGLTTDWGIAKLAVSADVLGTSNGIIADASYAYPFQASILTFTPMVGVAWTSSNYNDYYYGITSSESQKSGYRKYEADDGFSPYVGLNMRIDITDNFNLMLNGKASSLSDEITDSPMVDKNVKFSFGAGLSYSF